MAGNKKNKPTLSAAKAVEIWRTMTSLRCDLFPEDGFHTMVEAWERIIEALPSWSIKTYISNEHEALIRQAGVVYFAEKATLTVDRRLLENAEARCGFSNFILAHEIAHLELGHHSRRAKNINFVLGSVDDVNKVIPQDQLELEANFGAIVFQCGPILLDESITSRDLAKRAFSDVAMVQWTQRLVRLDAFRRELDRQNVPKKRIVL